MTDINVFDIDKSFKKINKHYSNESQYKFWKDGYITIPITKFQREKYLLNQLIEITNDLETNFFVKNKYESYGQFDLKPENKVINHLLSFIKKTNLLEILSFITCSQLILTDINIRINKNLKTENSFWGKHRDTSFIKKNLLKGRVPSTKILIYYPNLNDSFNNDNQLKIWPGSHKKVFVNRVLDNLSTYFQKKKIFKTDSNNMILFDGSIMHEIGTSSNKEGNLRLIFGFVDKQQLNCKIENYNNVIKWNKIINEH